MADYDDMPPLEEASPILAAAFLRPMNPPSYNTNVPNGINNTIVPVTHRERDSSDEEGWDMVEEECSAEPENSLCLFCNRMSESVVLLLTHMKEKHLFDLQAFVVDNHGMDQIAFIKMINYVRKFTPSVDDLKQIDCKIWNEDTYMKPTLLGDQLLMFDVEDLPPVSSKRAKSDCCKDYAQLEAKCEELQDIVKKQRQTLSRLLDEEELKKPQKTMKTVSDLELEEDEGYFNSYAYFEIHHEMLSDKVRTESYRRAIMDNGALLNGKQVLDLGCGTAILSMFCAKVGAIVTGIDMSEVIYHAMDIVKENGFEEQITLEKGRLEDIEFEHKFDVIVSEWMGYFLLFEGMLDSVLYARDHHLVPGGIMLPNRCTMHIVGLEDHDTYNKLVKFWDDVYGFKMTCMRYEVITEAATEVVKSDCICTKPAQIADLNLMTITPQDTEFTCPFSLPCTRDGHLTGFVGYFDTFFELPNSVYFSTSAHDTPTHWKQTLFYLPKPRPIKKDEVLHGTISVRRKKKEVRSLDVIINFDSKRYNYFVE